MTEIADQTSAPDSTFVRVATWNMDYWKRTVEQRERGWALLAEQNVHVALLQESVPPRGFDRSRCAYRQIGGNRGWGSAVVTPQEGWRVEEIQTVRTRYSGHRFPMLGSYPGATMVAQVDLPNVGPMTFVSIYAVIDWSYSRTTLFRILADLIPLFDSSEGQNVIVGGDFNLPTQYPCSSPDRKRHLGVLDAFHSVGLVDLTATAKRRPARQEGCRCEDENCLHIPTYRGKDGQPPIQLDYLMATKTLADRCGRLVLLDDETKDLSDHVPIVADFEIPTLERSWSLDGFLHEVEVRTNAMGRRVVEEMIAWAERKQGHLERSPVRRVDLLRLPISAGPDPEMAFQLDVGQAIPTQWTCGVWARGEIEMKFQWMRECFGEEPARESLWREVNQIVGGLDKRLAGRPRFPLNRLHDSAKLAAFLGVLDRIVDDTLSALAAKQGVGS